MVAETAEFARNVISARVRHVMSSEKNGYGGILSRKVLQ